VLKIFFSLKLFEILEVNLLRKFARGIGFRAFYNTLASVIKLMYFLIIV